MPNGSPIVSGQQSSALLDTRFIIYVPSVSSAVVVVAVVAWLFSVLVQYVLLLLLLLNGELRRLTHSLT